MHSALCCYMFKHVFNIDSNVETIPMAGWNRHMNWRDTGLKWLMPSPNMPFPETASVYPGQVIWEGTNISEGRGTCRPFEIFGAPFLDTKLIGESLDPEIKKGCFLQEFSFRPTFHKWKGEFCNGFMIHIIDHHIFRPYFTTMTLLEKIKEIHGDRLKWKKPPYEYEYDKMPIDMILGDSTLRNAIEKGEEIKKIRDNWILDEANFLGLREQYLLYT